MRVSILILILFFSSVLQLHAQSKKHRPWKFGLHRFGTAMSYKYETKFKDATADTEFTSVSRDSAGSIYNTELMAEYIFFKMIGLEINLNLSPGQRNFAFETDNEQIGNIVEEVKSVGLLGMNFYFGEHTEGLNYYLGFMTGSFTVTHSFTDGGDRPANLTTAEIDLKAQNFNTSQSSSIAVPVRLIKIGLDWVLERVGFNVYYATNQADEIVTHGGLGETKLDQRQTETVALTGGLTFGIFVNF